MAFDSASLLPPAAVATVAPPAYPAVRQQSAALVQPLLPEDTVVQPSPDVSPPKWHLAHTTWFWETMLLGQFLPGYQVYNLQYAYLFNSYYNSLGSRVNRADRGTISRPPLSDVYQYRAYVDEHMARLLAQLDTLPPLAAELLELGLHHEQQHQELLATDIKYILSTNPLAPGYLSGPPQPTGLASDTPATWLPVPGGIYALGHQAEGFSFDNELPVHEVLVAPFELQNRLVTNADFLRFVEAGGYQQFQFWLGEGWELVNSEHWTAPLYWSRTAEGQWLRYGPRGLEPLQLAAPVSHVSFYEADAYAQWAGARLPTEAEWEVAARHFGATTQGGTWLESNLFDPQPLAADADPAQCHQLLGDCWEWTYSAYHPYPGYRRAAGALGEYNGKFMVNQLVLRGGSCATPENHIRLTYRNFFQADKRWQFTGIRLAR
ncbi:MAG: ergothioneine biosynthesis protein EgtB [Janthinobacterium lividum]